MGRQPTMAEHGFALPHPRLLPFARRYVGFRYEGLEPGSHLGLPSPDLTLVLSLGAPTTIAAMPDPHERPGDFPALVGGLHTRPATIAYGRDLFGVEISLTPRGARSLLGVPAGELAERVVGLEELIGPASVELLERVSASATWPERFAQVDAVLGRRIARVNPAAAQVDCAWQLIVRSGGAIRVDEIAAAVGWSRRHLTDRFAREYGVTPKDAARVARFDASCRVLRSRPHTTLAALAAETGYADQSHMARDWNRFAARPPSAWLATEELPFVQDTAAPRVGSSEHRFDVDARRLSPTGSGRTSTPRSR